MESVYVMTGRTVWREATKFWGTLFGINFAMGVATGVTMEFQFGTNWAYYSHYVGDIFGAPLAIEGLMAFFLEATFVGLFFFGWNRLSKVAASRRHLARRARRQFLGAVDPRRQRLDAESGRRRVQSADDAHGADLLHARCCSIPSRSRNSCTRSAPAMSPARCSSCRSAPITCLRRRHVDIARRSLTVAASFGLASALSVVVLGDESGYTAGENQKMKIAAIEAMWETEPPPASFTLFGIPDLKSETTKYEVKIPWLLGLIATRSLDTPVEGIKALVERCGEAHPQRLGRLSMARERRRPSATPPFRRSSKPRCADLGHSLLLKRIRPDIENATDEQIQEAAQSTIPDVPVLFWSFRIMVALGFYFIALFAVAFYLSSRRRCGKPWFLRSPCIACRCHGSPPSSAGSSPNMDASRGSSTATMPTFLGVSNMPAS